MLSVRFATVVGMASMEEEMYILYHQLCNGREAEMRVYSNVDFTFRRCLPVPQNILCLLYVRRLHELLNTHIYAPTIDDMVACAEHKCLYVVASTRCVYKIMTDHKLRHDATWPETELLSRPVGLSLIRQEHEVLLLVVCATGELVKVNERGRCVHTIVLQASVKCLYHAVQLHVNTGHYVVSYREKSCVRCSNVISIVDDLGRVMRRYGDWWTLSVRELLRHPVSVAVDSDGFVFVADIRNNRVMLLSPSLQFVRSIETEEPPMSLHLDQKSRRLSVRLDSSVSIFQL